eukprot:1340602-Amphidinium_carterae.2
MQEIACEAIFVSFTLTYKAANCNGNKSGSAHPSCANRQVASLDLPFSQQHETVVAVTIRCICGSVAAK